MAESSSGVQEAEEVRIPDDQRRGHGALAVIGNDAECFLRTRSSRHGQTKERRLQLQQSQTHDALISFNSYDTIFGPSIRGAASLNQVGGMRGHKKQGPNPAASELILECGNRRGEAKRDESGGWGQAWTGHCAMAQAPPSTNTGVPGPLLVILPVITSNGKW